MKKNYSILALISRTSFVVLAMAMLLTITGCNDPVKAPTAGSHDLLHPDDYPEISVQYELRKVLRFERPMVTPSDGERPMQVVVGIRNIEKYGIKIQYQFEFFDANGKPLTPDSSWRYERLPVRLQKYLTSNAMTVNATSFRLSVRSAR